MRRRIGVVVAVGSLTSAVGDARAEHGMAMPGHHHDQDAEDTEISVGLTVAAAELDTAAYTGSYQAVTPAVTWMRGKLGAGAALPVYRLERNGLPSRGLGDAMVTGHATLLASEHWAGGAALHVMLPTGSQRDQLGMGHVMVMPSIHAAWQAASVAVAVSAGYGRALASMEGGEHDHGPAPLVDPMNMQELTWSAGADVDVGHRVRVGGRALGGIALGAGSDRVVGGGRVGWTSSRVSAGLELQAGLVGDPFQLRGIVETALRF